MIWAWHPEDPIGISVEHRHSTPLYDEAQNSYVLLQKVEAPVFNDVERYLHAFAPDGQLRWCWDRDVGGRYPVPPALSPDGTLYVVVHKWVQDEDPNDGLYALDLDGNERWSVLMYNHYISALAVGDDGTAYIAGRINGDNMIRAIDPDGGIVWSHPVAPAGGPFTSFAVAPDGTIFIGVNYDFHPLQTDEPPLGAILAVAPDGTPKWTVYTDLVPYGGLAVDATGAVYALTRNCTPPTLVGLEPDGSIRLSVDLDDPSTSFWGSSDNRHYFSSCVVLGAGGRLYVGSTEGRLHIVHP